MSSLVPKTSVRLKQKTVFFLPAAKWQLFFSISQNVLCTKSKVSILKK